MQQTKELLRFGEFCLDVHARLLLRAGEPVKLTLKEFDVLLYLARNTERVVSRDELHKAGWPDTHVDQDTPTRCMSAIRAKLGDKEQRIIETVPKIGYRFAAPVNTVTVPLGSTSESGDILEPHEPATTATMTVPAVRHLPFWQKRAAVLVLVTIAAVACLGIVLAGSSLRSQPRAEAAPLASGMTATSTDASTDEAEIRQVLKDSQSFESLVVYRQPDQFEPAELGKYFVPASMGGKSAQSIEAALKRQLERGYRYGPEARLEQFDILHVRVLPPGDYAEARTRERWYLPVVREDGSRVVERNPFLGPYALAYTLRKIDGRWLVQSATTPYTN